MSQRANPPRPDPPAERASTVLESAVNPPDRTRPQGPAVERSATVLETDEDLRQALISGVSGRPTGPSPVPSPTATAPSPAPPVPAAGKGTNLFRPSARPPVALLTVYDDGKLDGEVIRIRDHRFVIGRNEGDLRIPIDGRISARHVEITHQVVGGMHRWVVTDMQSTHGLYVRVSKTVLADQAELLIGSGRYRFDAPQADPGATADFDGGEGARGATQGWDGGPGPFRPPALTELLGKEIGNRTLLVKAEYWVGSDPACPICRPDDPFCEPRHVRLYRDPRGAWHAENNKTQNGLWLRMPQITVESMIQFQIGEQRFRLKVQ